MTDALQWARVASGIAEEYKLATFPSEQRERKFYFILDRLVYEKPEDAIQVFGFLAKLALSPQAIEGIGGGAVREMLMLYPKKYDAVLDSLASGNYLFKQALVIARDGML